MEIRNSVYVGYNGVVHTAADVLQNQAAARLRGSHSFRYTPEMCLVIVYPKFARIEQTRPERHRRELRRSGLRIVLLVKV